MLDNGFKMEVEAMISKDFEYLTGEYVPMKLKDKKQWLDYVRRQKEHHAKGTTQERLERVDREEGEEGKPVETG